MLAEHTNGVSKYSALFSTSVQIKNFGGCEPPEAVTPTSSKRRQSKVKKAEN